MIRFSARGDYLLLAPQRRALIRDKAVIRDRALIKKRALTGISFLENQDMQNKALMILFEENQEDWKKDLLSLDPS